MAQIAPSPSNTINLSFEGGVGVDSIHLLFTSEHNWKGKIFFFLHGNYRGVYGLGVP